MKDDQKKGHKEDSVGGQGLENGGSGQNPMQEGRS